MSRVFIPQQPSKRDPLTGEMRRVLNIDPAAKFGKVEEILELEDFPLSRESLGIVEVAMSRFTENDWLIPMGHPALIGICAALAIRATGGTLRMLIWDGTGYNPFERKVYG